MIIVITLIIAIIIIIIIIVLGYKSVENSGKQEHRELRKYCNDQHGAQHLEGNHQLFIVSFIIITIIGTLKVTIITISHQHVGGLSQNHKILNEHTNVSVE